MKRFIATTAMALILGTVAYAAEDSSVHTYQHIEQGDILASNLIGMRVYADQKNWEQWDEDSLVDAGAEQEWDDIGEVNDVIIGQNGNVKAVILGVGGLIGIGEKDVTIQMSEIKFVREDGDNNDFFLVVNTNKEMLTDAKPFERGSKTASVGQNTESRPKDQIDQQATATTHKSDKNQQTAELADDNAATVVPRERPFVAPDVSRDGYVEAEPAELTAEELQGARVYGSQDEDVGEISELILDGQGKIKQVVIDVGGFLGIGEHPVAVSFEDLRILHTEDRGDFRVYIDASKEALEQQPAYKAKI